MIINKELKPGEKIIQEKVAEQLGVSRTPLMKALQTLENEMLVESIPRRGVYVKSLNLQELIDVYDCREVLEGMAARKLAENHDLEDIKKLEACFAAYDLSEGIDSNKYTASDELFHKLLIELVGNVALNKAYFIGNIFSEVVNQGLLRTPEETLQEHHEIIEAIKNKDTEKAENAARAHIRNSKLILIEQIKKDK
ncbi:MAG: GntR family transcriptional regulator [Cyclobacteriaceae bacterium]